MIRLVAIFFLFSLPSVIFSDSIPITDADDVIQSEESISKDVTEDERMMHIPCSSVVDGRKKCIETGFKESVCVSPVITESDVTCPSPSNPTIFLLPGNEKERFVPARFMICMEGGKWMISGLDGSFMGDDGISSPIHVVCFPEIPQEEQSDPFDELDDDELEEKFGDKKEELQEKTEL